MDKGTSRINSIIFKQSVINYLFNTYPQSYEWYFDEEGLVCEYGGRARTICYDKLIDTFNLYLTGGFYSQTKQPLWQRELELLLEGS